MTFGAVCGVLYRSFETLVIAYVGFVNLAYFALMLISYFALKKEDPPFSGHEIDTLLKSPFVPSVSVLAPAYNESATVRDSIRAMLRLRHPCHEVIVINDGSSDNTLGVLIEEFRLYRSSRVAMGEIPTAPVRGVYESRDPIPLIVIDKKNGGKSDALNCGLNYSRKELVAVVDADSIIERDALLQISRPFLERPDETVAVGGLIRVANGCAIENGELKRLRTPDSHLARFQIIDYLRAFLGARVALSFANTLLVISGAFGMFRRKILVDAGGYRLNTVGEDMELVVRLHRLCREQKKPCHIELSSSSICWTEAPEAWRILRRQRTRWQRGCVESILFHGRTVGNARFGVIGLVGMPYFLLCEIFGPLVEVAGYILTIIGLLFGILSAYYVVLFFGVSVLFGLLLSVGAVVLEELTICKYPNLSDLLRLLQTALLENLGYRQTTLLWRLQGVAQCLMRRKRVWGDMERRGFRRAA